MGQLPHCNSNNMTNLANIVAYVCMHFSDLHKTHRNPTFWFQVILLNRLTLDVLPNIAETLVQSCYNNPGHSVSAPNCR